MITITKAFEFQSAHHLPKVPEGHKCRNLHGHSYRVEISLSGEVNELGWVVDFADVESAVVPLLKQIDHRCLNDVVGLENPTAENIVLWFKQHLSLPGMSKIRVFEESTCWAEWQANL